MTNKKVGKGKTELEKVGKGKTELKKVGKCTTELKDMRDWHSIWFMPKDALIQLAMAEAQLTKFDAKHITVSELRVLIGKTPNPYKNIYRWPKTDIDAKAKDMGITAWPKSALRLVAEIIATAKGAV